MHFEPTKLVFQETEHSGSIWACPTHNVKTQPKSASNTLPKPINSHCNSPYKIHNELKIKLTIPKKSSTNQSKLVRRFSNIVSRMSRYSCGRLGGNVMFVPYATVEIISHVPSNRRAGCGSSSSCGASSSSSGFGSGFFKASADWKETLEAHVFMLDLPGMTKEEVKVEVVDEGRVLEISGERKEKNEEENGVKLREERGRGKFVRRFRLPRNVNVEEVKAEMEYGVLTVIVPKLEEKKPETKSVEISGC